MANDPKQGPAPRPRRRRTDIDPNAPTPKVANERRRRKAADSTSADRPATSRARATDAGRTADAKAAEAADAANVAPTAEVADAADTASAVVESPGSAAMDAAPTTVFHLPGGAAFASRSPSRQIGTSTVRAVDDDATAASGPDPLIGSSGTGDVPARSLGAGGWSSPPPPVAPDDAPLGSVAAAADPAELDPADVDSAGASPTATASASPTTPAGGTDGVPVATVDEVPLWLDRLDDRSPDARVCPFLRSAADGGLVAPIEQPDATNRCAALRDVVPQSLRQQQLVCLSTGHVSCPRYLRGSAVALETPVAVVRARKTISAAMLGSLLLVVMAFSASVAFVLARGGLELTGGLPGVDPSPSSSAVAVVSPSPVPSVVPTPTITPGATPTPTPTPTPSPEPTPAPTPKPTPEPPATSDRYRLLTACPGTPNCWIYRVRSGDNLYSIANYFGVSLDSIYDRNPWVRQTGLRAGQELRLPPPTR